MRAVFGASSSNERIALVVLLRARSSSTWPSNTSVMMTAAGSKYNASFTPREHGDQAVQIRGSSAHGNQREHVQAAISHGSPPRARKNGQPAHNTTGVARAICSQAGLAKVAAAGIVSASAIQKRRCMSASSGFASSAADLDRLQRHAANRAASGTTLAHFRMHGARVFGVGLYRESRCARAKVPLRIRLELRGASGTAEIICLAFVSAGRGRPFGIDAHAADRIDGSQGYSRFLPIRSDSRNSLATGVVESSANFRKASRTRSISGRTSASVQIFVLS